MPSNLDLPCLRFSCRLQGGGLASNKSRVILLQLARKRTSVTQYMGLRSGILAACSSWYTNTSAERRESLIVQAEAPRTVSIVLGNVTLEVALGSDYG